MSWIFYSHFINNSELETLLHVFVVYSLNFGFREVGNALSCLWRSCILQLRWTWYFGVLDEFGLFGMFWLTIIEKHVGIFNLALSINHLCWWNSDSSVEHYFALISSTNIATHICPLMLVLRNPDFGMRSILNGLMFKVGFLMYIYSFQTSNIKALYKLTGRGRLHLDLSHSPVVKVWLLISLYQWSNPVKIWAHGNSTII